MIRDLGDPAAATIIQRHQRYWDNEPDDRPLFQVHQAHPLADTPNPHVLEPPEPFSPFVDHAVPPDVPFEHFKY